MDDGDPDEGRSLFITFRYEQRGGFPVVSALSTMVYRVLSGGTSPHCQLALFKRWPLTHDEVQLLVIKIAFTRIDHTYY